MKTKRKFLIILLAIIGSIGLVSAIAIYFPRVGADQDKANLAFQKGYTLYVDYKYDAAVPFFLESLSHNPEFHLPRRFLGQSLYMSGSIDEAVKEWNLLFEQNYSDPALKVHLQNLNPPLFETKTLSVIFHRDLQRITGYNYVHPTFVGSLPDHRRYFLATDQVGIGNLILVDVDGQYQANYRRLSEKLQLPIAGAVGDTELWVTDLSADMIHRWNFSKGPPLPLVNELKKLGEKGSKPGQFHGPAGICSLNNAFYIVDSGNNRIQKIDFQGKFIFEFSLVQDGFKLNRPFGILCFSNGQIYVSEPELGRISVFDKHGNFEAFFEHEAIKKPRHIQTDPHEKYLIISDEQSGVVIMDRETNHHIIVSEYSSSTVEETQKIFRPYSATIDHFGGLFIADYSAHRVSEWLPENRLYSNLDIWVERIDAKQFPIIGVWVSVKNSKGDYLTDLTGKNFKLSENDADVGLLGDSYLNSFADQMTVVMLQAKTRALANHEESILHNADFILKKIRLKDQIKIMSYSSSFREDSFFENSRLKLREALKVRQEDDYQNNLASATDTALYSALNQLLNAKGKRALVWITDGSLDTSSYRSFSLSKLQNFAKINHIPVYIISYEDPQAENYKGNIQILKDFAAQTHGKYFRAFDNKVQGIENLIRNQKEQRLVLSYQSELPWAKMKGLFTDIRIRVDFQQQTGIEKSGYFVP